MLLAGTQVVIQVLVAQLQAQSATTGMETIVIGRIQSKSLIAMGFMFINYQHHRSAV